MTPPPDWGSRWLDAPHRPLAGHDHPLLQPDPPYWGFRDLTKEQAKAIDAEHLRRIRGGHLQPMVQAACPPRTTTNAPDLTVRAFDNLRRPRGWILAKCEHAGERRDETAPSLVCTRMAASLHTQGSAR
jgi:hypothetical protein